MDQPMTQAAAEAKKPSAVVNKLKKLWKDKRSYPKRLLYSAAVMLAFCFTAPISALIHLCDREPGRHDEAFERMEAFMQHFISIHAVE